MMATIYYCQEEGCPVSITLQGGEMTTSTVKVHHNTAMKAVQVDQKILESAQHLHRLYCLAHGEITSEHVMREVAAVWDELGRARQEFFFRLARAEREEAHNRPECPLIQIDIQEIRDLVRLAKQQNIAQFYIIIDEQGKLHGTWFVGRSDFVLQPNLLILITVQEQTEEAVIYAVRMLLRNRKGYVVVDRSKK
jgi:hypothetical protein